MGNDFQKREAKRSLWDGDGQHIPKRYRNKSKGRHKDKQLVSEELAAMDNAASCPYGDSCMDCKKAKRP